MIDDSPLPRDASVKELSASVEANLFALFRQMATLPGAAMVASSGLAMHDAPFSNPMFRGVWDITLDDANADDEIDAALRWFRERGAPFCFWWTGPQTEPSDLPARLARHGLTPFEVEAPGMVAAIDALDTEAMNRAPAALLIEPVANEEQLAAFEEELMAAFEMPDWAARGWSDATRAAGIDRAPWRFYLARMGAEPVGTAIQINGGGVAGVIGIAVRDAWRGRGIGSAITLRPLLDARAEGYHHAALFATSMGEPVYARLGFRRCNALISRYLWRNQAR